LNNNTDPLKFSSCDSKINNIPSPDIFGKSIYMFYIGQNDFTSKIAYSGGLNGLKNYVSEIIFQIASAIKV
jgi:hypothetical protein